MDQSIRNKLRNVVTQCRKLLEDAVAQVLQGQFGIYATGKKDEVHVDDDAKMKHLSDEDRAYRKDILDHLEHVKALGYKPTDSLAQLVREIAFTHLNRFCAYKMMEARSLIRESVSKGLKSQGFLFYLADHEDDEKRASSGQQDVAYRHFLNWLGGTLSEEIGVLFNPHDSANRLYPPQRVLEEVLEILNDEALADIWTQDETIGWVYQYFTPKELRDQVRKESAAPRNSYELAFRNQFFTPRYVVEFLTDNTLGRIWYEMRKGSTKLKDQCRYMVRRPTEIFMKDGEQPPKDATEGRDELSQEKLLKLPVYIPHRPKKDPRELKILDPACGSGHFLLYCFDLLLTIYEEAYEDPDLGPALQQDYLTLETLRRDIPRLILAHNLHGIDIDLRASQIAALALWLRCQRAYQEMGLKKDRPKITRSNFVCAEPMPGEPAMLKEFVGQLEPRLLGQIVEVVFDRMKLAGEAGSLLKIEEELRTAVASAKQQWEAGPIEVQRTLFDRSDPKPKQKRFNLSGVTDDEFFNEAEAKVVEALRSYAEKATNGQRLQRRLFTDDAVRGFAFVDLCHKRFDVVLMNPPFGESIPSLRKTLADLYPLSAQDLGMAFVDRGFSLLCEKGRVGALTSRTFLANDGMSDWRHTRLLGTKSRLAAFADLGYGVLDDAMVEAAAYVVASSSIEGTLVFHNLLSSTEKHLDLANAVQPDSRSQHNIIQHLDLFKRVPEYMLCYWLPAEFLTATLAMPNIVADNSPARVGLQTGDNHRFVRAVWEVSPEQIGKERTWSFFAKGGEYEPYYDDIHLVVFWEDDGAVIKNFVNEAGKLLSRPQNLSFYHAEGITYPDRTTSDFSPRVMPKGIVFSSTGFALFPKTRRYALGYLGAAYTRPFKVLVEAFVGSGDTSVSGSAARHYRPGVLNMLPNLIREPAESTCNMVLDCVKARIREFVTDETTRYFESPFANSSGHSTSLAEIAFTTRIALLTLACELINSSAKLERAVLDSFGHTKFAGIFDDIYGQHPAGYGGSLLADESQTACDFLACDEIELVNKAKELLGASRQVIKKSYFADRRLELVSHILKRSPQAIVEAFREGGGATQTELVDCAHRSLSYGVGLIYGRWDCRVLSERGTTRVPHPFDELPVCSPGMLVDGDRLPQTQTPVAYPLRIDWDGILVDDPDHADDIVRRERDVFEVVWKQRADLIEKEACQILGVNDLRDYFRKPGKGGFWDDHISRYSKSRRKAPIYWLLQSSKKNYAVWLYYHRFDNDLLFKALVNYVEPKIRMEVSRLDSLRSQKAAAANTGKAAKKIDTEIEKQEDFISELQDFEDKLRRAADLHLEPDLNDGVVLNIAPLHDLVPWKEAKSYWNELLEGKYEWSSIGKQLREKGLVK